MTYAASTPQAAANCCLPPARCSPGPICQSLRWQRDAIRACLTIVLRGALDGLAAVAPVGDPDWAKLRGDKALALNGATPALPLDNFFALNPAMPNLHRLYKAGAATFVHASATPYRERSHFDGQDVLESGLVRPGAASIGWLNRALTTLAPAQRANPKARNAFAVGPIAPLVVRGPAPVLSWTPPQLPSAGDDMKMRLLELYRHTDPALARVLEERMNLSAIARSVSMEEQGQRDSRPLFSTSAVVRAYFEQSAGTAAKFLARPDGPRVGALAFDGWDTHANDGALDGRLAALLGALDAAVAAIETNMGDGLARDRGGGDHRVRPHGPHQWHGRYRPRHWHCRHSCRRRAEGGPRAC